MRELESEDQNETRSQGSRRRRPKQRRGEDTRKNFTDHLYSALKQVGIRTFRDDEELPRGENISTELLNAIRRSRIFIVIFSKNYASSRWCLNELVEIVDYKKTRGQTLLPIFYHVDTSDVRKQTGPFAKAFSSHEALFQTDMERVQRWRAALIEATNCSGWDLDANGYESIIIQEIVEEVLCKVNPAHLDVAIHPVGLQSRVEEIKALLNLGTNNVRIVGFHGMAGIGKTTLAKAVYNEICHLFEGSSFLSNVKEISNESNGLVHLQEQLLYDILHKKNWNVYNVHRGISLIKERIQGKKVLVVVDDVDHLDQLHALVGNFKLFDLRSRLIVTTRNDQLLTLLEVDEIYKVEELNHRESLQLFKWHAFKMTHPIKEYLELSVSVVKYTGGLPLALVVLGSSLFGKSVDEWKSKLKKLQKIPDGEIQKKLKISFDSLDDYDTTKDIFLDIACFFIGMEKEYVIKILHACDFFVEDGLSILIQRSLVTIDDNKLRMHDLIRDMGRGIVLAESPNNPGKQSRLWFHEDVLNVLSKHTGSDTVKGLMLNLLVHEDLHLKTEGFTNMKNLRLLQINDVHLTGSYKHLSKELKWLCWHKCPLKLLPQDFYLENLVILDMQQSNVKQVWKKKKNFNQLKVLNLSNSKDLTTSPNFSQVPQLEILILEGCTSLVHVHESIGHLKRLVSLNLKNCANLKDLPRSIFNLESLETLDLSSCLALKKLPDQLLSSFGVLKNLKTLSLYGCSHLTELPNFLQAPHLKGLVLEGCTSLVKIHESIGLLKRLVLLDFRRCEKLKNLPSNISNLESLETLDLSGCLALENLPEQLPSSFGLLKNLKNVSLYGCSRLIALPNFSHATHLESLELEGCTCLVEIHESIGLLKRLVLLNLRRCEKLRNLPSSISNLESLEILDLSGCLKLYKLPEHLGNMTALWKLVADGTAIEQLPSSLGLLRNLSVLSLSGCGGPSSSWISPKSSNHISLPPSICRLSSLRELNLSDRNLSEDEIPIEFVRLSSLEILDLSRNNFRNLPNCISCLPELQYLYLNECTTLQSISLHKSVQVLGANGCTSLERILILTKESSGSFYLDNCHKLVEIQCLESLQPGAAVFMGRCNNLANDFRRSVVIQMCKTYGDCSLCLPGSEIPNWISHKTIGSLISFRVPSFFDGQIGRLLLCVVYAVNEEAPKLSRRDGLFKLTFCNKSFSDTHKSYWRTCFDIFEDHICAQVMQFNQIELEINSGDEIQLSVDLIIDGRPLEDHQQSIKVNKCGILLLPGCERSSSSRISPKSSNCMSYLPTWLSEDDMSWAFSKHFPLTSLNLSNCNLSEDDISIKFGFLYSLESLSLSRNNFRNLPSCISCLPKLKNLYLDGCTTLQSISLPRSVIVLSANGCTSLERISILTNESSGSYYLDNLDKLEKIFSYFNLNNCRKLVEIQSLESLRCVPSTVRLRSCNNLSSDSRRSVLQMMCSKSDGVCSVLLPGSEIPNWISHQTIGSSISFRVPSYLDGKMGKMLLCIVYAGKKKAPRDMLAKGGFFRWRLCNKSSRDQSNNWDDWNDVGSHSAIPKDFDFFEDHILAQVRTDDMWRLNRSKMKSGDEIEVAIDLQMWGRGTIDNSIKCGIDPQFMEVKRCGIHLLVDEHEPN